MNNEEKKPQEQVGPEQETVNDVKAASNQASGFGGWWKSVSTGVKTAIIAGISCLVVAVVVLCVLLLGGKGPDGPDGPGGGGGDGGKTVTYTISVVTKGGMPLADLPVYIHEYEDGSIGEIVNYVATNAEGKATVKLSENGQYAANISMSIPEGYDANSFYPLVSTNLDIVVSSSVILDDSLSGVSYTTGSVMRDFSVTTTTGETFTLSEVLKEKDAVLINFWFSTCGPCVNEFPLMVEAYEKYKEDLAIIALNPPETQAQDTLDDIKMFQSTYGLTFDVAQDLQGLNRAFGVTGFPTSVMIDRYGVVTMVETGGITSERVFDVIFDYFTGDNYEQKLIYDYNDIVPKEKPNVEMPSSEELGSIFDKGMIGDITYIPYRDTASDDEKEYSWPFVIDQLELNGTIYDVIKTSNAFKEGSFAQMIFNVDLEAGDVLAFDYLASTELGADILYVVVDGKDIYSISGEGSDWETCYAFVAEESATYEVGLVYQKDSSDNVGNDTVYLKDLRIVTEADIDSPAYIYRFAATNPDNFSNYQDYVDIYLGSDGYYHVDSENGPILLADLMSYTRFAEDDTAYYMAGALLNDGLITEAEYNKIIEYCNYASNASIYGVSPVTPELKELLVKIATYYGDAENEKDWMRFCCYYDAYGTNGKQLEDPIKGLALFSAYDVILSNKGDTDFPNSFTYDRVIMPRGLLGKFTPTVSGTYLITSNTYDTATGTYPESNAWIFTEGTFGERLAWLTYENVDRLNVSDNNNCYMIAYLEAGKDYYIDIAYYDVYGEGTIKYRVERLGGEGVYRFSLASPGFFTALENQQGELTETIAGGIDVVLGEDKIWREKRNDGREGSILYADFTMTTPIFTNKTLEQMIALGSFDFSRTEGDQYILNYLEQFDGDVDACDAYLREMWGDEYDTYDEIYQLQDVYNGIYHGEGEDYTELAEKYLAKKITVGYNADLKETIAEGDERIGCVIVTEELADLLQTLMDKYTFEGVENSWRKLCYYHQYFCAATPK